MVLSSNGAMAAWSSCGYVYAGSSRNLANLYLSKIFATNANRIGDGIIQATHDAALMGETEIIKAYNLLGDPATAIWNQNEARTSPFFLAHSVTYSNWLCVAIPPVLYDKGNSLGENDDPDMDGLTNYEEYKSGTNPFDGDSVLRITGFTRFNGNLVIQWTALNHKTYSITSTTNMLQPFSTIIAASITGTYPTASFTNAIIEPIQFYRIETAIE